MVNLYSAALGFNAIKPTWHEWKIIIGCGILGAFMASLNLLDSFTHFIFSLSIIFSPVASIYTVDFFIIRRQRRYNISELPQVNAFNIPAIIAWGCGISASLMANQGWFTLTSIEVCDAMLVTVPVYFLAHKWAMRSNASISQ